MRVFLFLNYLNMNKKSIRTLDALLENQLVAETNSTKLSQVVNNFAVGISPQMQKLIDSNDSEDPIAKQFVPTIDELDISPLEIQDPIGDDRHTMVKGVIHRYSDRCLLTPIYICPVYCRFCFRREKIATANTTLTPQELDVAFNYIDHHKEIWEVILTGGDPLILKAPTLKKIIDRLCEIDHVEVIRIHTRVPVVDSQRINQEMIKTLKCKKAIFVILHANHPNEFTSEASQACNTLIDAGIPMLSQTVLLKNLNDNIETLSTLMRCFIKHRIKPLYLHHSDLVRGTKHFRTSITHGQQLIKQLRGHFSGICQPTYVLDIPGGYGKVPIGPNYIKTLENDKRYRIEDYLGNMHEYISDV